MASSVDRQIEGLKLLVFAPAERAVAELAAYSEDDDIATQRVEAAASEPHWIVRVTAFDRRMMSTEELVAELLRGELVGPETLVWRGGMDNWRPLSRALDLGAAAARTGAGAPARVMGGATRPAPALERSSASVPLTLSLAIAVSSFALTLAALTLCGVFEPPSGGAPPLAETD